MTPMTRRVLGSLALLFAFLFAGYLGIAQGAEKPPTQSTNVLLIVLTGVFQLAGYVFFDGIGKADPGLARSAVRRLIALGVQTHAARKIAEANEYERDGGELRAAVGKISAMLSAVEEGLVDSVKDWQEFRDEALRELTKEEGSDG